MSGPVHYHEGRFPPHDLDWGRLVPLIGPANGAVARYDGMLAAIPNAHVLLSPLTTQEAVLSSRIEGTQATMGEVLEYEPQISLRLSCDPQIQGWDRKMIAEWMSDQDDIIEAPQDAADGGVSGIINAGHITRLWVDERFSSLRRTGLSS